MIMRKVIFGTIAMLVSSVVLTACSSNEDFYDPDMGHKAKAAEYEQAFTQEFGTVAKGHSWGFVRGNTRGVVTNAPLDADMYLVPASIDNEGQSSKAVRDAFVAEREKLENNQTNALRSSLIAEEFDFSEPYFLQHVCMAQWGNNNGGNGQAQLIAYDFSKPGWIDVTNFEKGKNESWFYCNSHKAVKGVVLMQDMGTPTQGQAMFGYKDKNGVEKHEYSFLKYNNAWYLGVWTNYQQNKPTAVWVIKLSKALPDEVVEEGRIMCEDMGFIGDFDFNDLVADMKIRSNGDIDIEILAAGGEYPIFIDGQSVTMGKIVNTGWNTAPIQIMKIPAKDAATKTPKYAHLIDIPITVRPGGAANEYEEPEYELTAEEGKIPQKICTRIGVNWPLERTSIKDAYSTFSTYVNTAQPDKWNESQDQARVYFPPSND